MKYNDGTYEENGEVWFVGYEDNIIYHMNTNHETEIVAKIPVENTDTYRMNPICIKDNNRIICLPSRSKSIYIYDIVSDKFDEIAVQLNVARYSIDNAWIVDDVLWCISYRSGDLIRCNLSNKNYKKYKVCDENLECASGEAINVGNNIYILHKDKCRITKFNIETEESDNYELVCDEKGFGTINYADGRFYLTGYKNNIYIWIEGEDRIKTVPIQGVRFILESDTTSNTARFYRSKIVNDYMVLLPYNNNYYVSDDVVVYNWKQNEVSVYSLCLKNKVRQCGDYLIYNYSVGNTIYIQDYIMDKFWKIDMETGIIDTEGLKVDRVRCLKFWKRQGVLGINQERDFFDLNMFLTNI
jgi:hypothetical protein